MSTNDDFDPIFKALAHARRRAILDCLKKEPMTTGGLCQHFHDMDRCTVMQHLKVLHDAGLVVVTREGRERWNHLNALPIKEIADRWIGDYAQHAVRMLSSLERDLGLRNKKETT
ncbi:helix-turn-helix transcriptional regulator [Telmatospirillum sp. J64-1]|uniref:ArsR/SmtB family transcription factor n=1 Tax=Telmatospirillum sp. J64-1 TaxID=2502183 RepID=UPI00115F1E74|nr:metalloregulator ArsR/SmtB family transcription factor [Telmatospirillum sp. J64-1]